MVHHLVCTHLQTMMGFDDEVLYVTTLRGDRKDEREGEGKDKGKGKGKVNTRTKNDSTELIEEPGKRLPLQMPETESPAEQNHLLGQFVVRNRQMGQVSLREPGTFWHRLTKRCAVWWTSWLMQRNHRHQQQHQPIPRPTPLISTSELEDQVFSPHTNRPSIVDIPSFESLTELAFGPMPFPQQPSISQLLQNFTKIEPSSYSPQLRKSASTPTFPSPKLRSSLRRRTATGLHVHFSPYSPSSGDFSASPLPHFSANIVPSLTNSYLHIINSCDSFFMTNSPQSI